MPLAIDIFLGVFFAKVADDLLIVLLTKRIRTRAIAQQTAGYKNVMERISKLHDAERSSAAKSKGE